MTEETNEETNEETGGNVHHRSVRRGVVVGAKKALVSRSREVHHRVMIASSLSRRVCVHTPWLLALGLALLAARPGAAAPLQDRPYGKVMGDGLVLHGGPSPETQAKVCAAGDTLFGIDVSYYQGDIDWNAVAANGVVFAWVRVSHSTQFEDPKFKANLDGARAAGVHTGVYQFFEPSQDPIAQADLLLAKLGPLMPGDMPPMIDIESQDPVPPGAYADAVRAWLDHVEQATGVTPFIYTGYYYWNDHLATDEFADHPLWIANYNPGCPLIPDAWATWTAHQYCDCGQVPGIAGNVDVNHFNGSEEDLLGYAVGGAVCGDAKCVFGESPLNCPSDCPPCGVVGPDGGTIDNGDACLELYGDPQYWRDEAVGQGGSLVWTNATEYDTPSNYAIWRLFFAEAGIYALDVWVEQPFGETKQAGYRVSHAGGETVVPVDQSAASGWVSLGEFSFDTASDQFVRMDDNTGEMNALEVSIACDALRITRVDEGGGSGTGGASTGGGTSEGGSSTASPTSSASDSGPVNPGGTSGDATGGTSGSASAGLPSDFGDEGSGCGCRGGSDPGGAGLLALGVLGLVRRRRGGAAG